MKGCRRRASRELGCATKQVSRRPPGRCALRMLRQTHRCEATRLGSGPRCVMGEPPIYAHVEWAFMKIGIIVEDLTRLTGTPVHVTCLSEALMVDRS